MLNSESSSEYLYPKIRSLHLAIPVACSKVICFNFLQRTRTMSITQYSGSRANLRYLTSSYRIDKFTCLSRCPRPHSPLPTSTPLPDAHLLTIASQSINSSTMGPSALILRFKHALSFLLAIPFLRSGTLDRYISTQIANSHLRLNHIVSAIDISQASFCPALELSFVGL